jgi:predicted exporter
VVFLAALTTVLSMGLMSLSNTFPVRSFGLAVAAGVTAAYLVSFLPARLARRVQRDHAID